MREHACSRAPCACHGDVLKTVGPWKLKTHFGFRIGNRKRVSCPSVSRVSIFAGASIEYEIPMHMSYASSKPCCPYIYAYNLCTQNGFSFYVIGFFPRERSTRRPARKTGSAAPWARNVCRKKPTKTKRIVLYTNPFQSIFCLFRFARKITPSTLLSLVFIII